MSQFFKHCMRPNTFLLPSFKVLIVYLMDFLIFEVGTMPNMLGGWPLPTICILGSLKSHPGQQEELCLSLTGLDRFGELFYAFKELCA